jgi:hypothetical protein
MICRSKAVWLAAAVWATTLGLPPAAQAQDGCSSPAKQRECSVQCCGRATCAPSCQGDCVRVCIDACRSPQFEPQYRRQLPDLQARCGFRSGPAQMQRQESR